LGSLHGIDALKKPCASSREAIYRCQTFGQIVTRSIRTIQIKDYHLIDASEKAYEVKIK
jgi:hypothetical protein